MVGPLIFRRLSVAGLFALLLPQPAGAADFCFCLACAFGTHASYTMPAGSMWPTIATGQCFIARLTDPEGFVPAPGDIVVIRRASDGQDYVKRVVALGGQTVGMAGGRLSIDGVPVATAPLPDFTVPAGVFWANPPCRTGEGGDEPCRVRQLRETLPNGASYAVLDTREDSVVDLWGPETVPAGHIYVLGDNRDNSLDSRIAAEAGGFGMVSLMDIVGVVE